MDLRSTKHSCVPKYGQQGLVNDAEHQHNLSQHRRAKVNSSLQVSKSFATTLALPQLNPLIAHDTHSQHWQRPRVIICADRRYKRWSPNLRSAETNTIHRLRLQTRPLHRHHQLLSTFACNHHPTSLPPFFSDLIPLPAHRQR